MDNGWVYPLAFVLSVYTLPPWGYNIPPPSHLIEERRLKSTGCKERDPLGTPSLAVPKWDDVRVRVGAQKLDETSRNSLNVEEFLAGLRFEQRNRLDGLQIDFP